MVVVRGGCDDNLGVDSGRLDRTTILALVAMGVAVLSIANDFTALAVALSAIERHFDS
jgi:hypothetical protein